MDWGKGLKMTKSKSITNDLMEGCSRLLTSSLFSQFSKKKIPPQNKAAVMANNTVVGSAIKNFVTDIFMTPAIRNICVLNPIRCLPKRTPIAPLLPCYGFETVKISDEFISNFNAKGLDRSNPMIVKRITNKGCLDGHKGSDTSR